MKRKILATLLLFVLLFQASATTIYAVTEEIDNNTNQIEERKELKQEDSMEKDAIEEQQVEEQEEKQEEKKAKITTGETENDETEVEIPDERLKDAILKACDENKDSIITVGEMKTLKELEVYWVEDLTGLENALNLKKLDLEAAYEINDYSPIKDLTSLEDLTIHGIGIDMTLDFLVTLVNLKELYLYRDSRSYTFKDISALENLINLEVLYIDTVDKTTNFSSLEKCTKLKSLTLIVWDSAIDDISFLSKLTNLEYVRILGVDLDSLDDLANCTELDGIEFMGAVRNIDVIKDLQKLRTVEINNTNEIEIDLSYLNHIKGFNSSFKIDLIKKINNANLFTNDEIQLDLSFVNLEAVKDLWNVNEGIIDEISIAIHEKGLDLDTGDGNSFAVGYGIGDCFHINNEQDLNNLKETLNNIKANKINLTSVVENINVGKLTIGEAKTFKISEISNLYNYLIDENSKVIYNGRIDGYVNDDDCSIDRENKTLTINLKKRNLRVYQEGIPIYVDLDADKGKLIAINFEVENPADLEEEIPFNNDQLKNYLLQYYDSDKNGKITQTDIDEITYFGFDLDDLTGLEYLTNLREIHISGKYTDLSPIKDLTKLNRITLYGKYTDASAISNLNNLTAIQLGTSENIDIDCSIFENMKELENVSIRHVQNITNIEVINGLEKLRYFDLDYSNLVTIKGLEKIEDKENLKIGIHVWNSSSPYKPEELVDFVKMLNNMKEKNVEISDLYINVELDDVYLEEEKILKFEELTPLVTFFKEKDENFEFEFNYDNRTDKITIDNEKQELTLSTSDIGKVEGNIRYAHSVNYDYYPSMYITLKYNVDINADNTKEIEIKDKDLKELLLRDYDYDNDEKITEYDLKHITELKEVWYVRDFSGLEYATNLKSIYNLEFDDNIDISIFKNFKKLEYIEMSLYEGSENMNLSVLEKIESLKKLNIKIGYRTLEIDLSFISKLKGLTEIKYTNYSKFNYDIGKILKNLNNLESIIIDSEIETIKDLANLDKLTTLDFRMPRDNDLSNLATNKNLDKIYIDNIKSELDVTSINNIEKLNYIRLQYMDMTAFKNFDKLEDRGYYLSLNLYDSDAIYRTDEEIENIINEICKVNFEKVSIQMSLDQKIDNIEEKTTATLNFEDLSYIYKQLYTEGTKLNQFAGKIGGRSVNSYQDWSDDEYEFNFDENTGIITLKRSKLGNYSLYSHVNTENLSISVYADYRIYVDEGNKEDEVNIPDSILKQEILKQDIDGDGKITEFDLINLLELDVHEMGIESLKGLEYAKNLERLDAEDNKIRDISPLMNCEKLEKANLADNYISDITCLKDRKIEYIAYLGLMCNDIDLTNDSENYKTLEEELRKDSEKMQEGDFYALMTYYASSQKIGTPEEIDNEVIFGDSRIKDKIIELGYDTNGDGKLTRRELSPYYYGYLCVYKIGEEYTDAPRLDLSNMGITDLSGLEYFVGLYELNLSNNNISDITPLKYLNNLHILNLSHNKITDLSAISNCSICLLEYEFQDWDFSYNEITSIAPMNNWYKVKNCYIEAWHDFDPAVRDININLSHNKITDISGVEDWIAILHLDLSYNEISDISNLKNYNFKFYPIDESIPEEYKDMAKLKIDFSGNEIDSEEAGVAEIVKLFEEKDAEIILKALVKGDLDGDGEISLYDAFSILRTAILDDPEMSLKDIEIMDYDGDGKVTLYDAFMILRAAILAG